MEEIKAILDNSTFSVKKKVDRLVVLKKFPVSGYSFCCHHNRLVEHCTNFRWRLTSILRTKKASEHLVRIINFTAIPSSKLPLRLRKAYVARQDAYAMWKKALTWLQKANTAQQKADAAQQKADAAWEMANTGLRKAEAAWKESDKLALFKKLCPANTWNGENIGLE